MRLMKLQDNGAFRLTTFSDSNLPPYAILSHTWGSDDSEVTFEDIEIGRGTEKAGYAKLLFCAQQARNNELEYFWNDTCCIKKTDSAELSKAITSMFRWYSRAAKCYVLLPDVSSDGRQGSQRSPVWWEVFRSSRYWKRGWTLQELLAPRDVTLYSKEGDLLGERASLAKEISAATTIPTEALKGAAVSNFSVDERMRWTTERETKEVEDRAYSLLGIFGVSLVPNYGEGIDNAVRRLSTEIAQKYNQEIYDAARNRLTARAPAPSSGSKDLTETQDEAGMLLQARIQLLERLRSPNLDARRSNIKDAQSNTCQWFLEHHAVRSWDCSADMDDHHGFLWVLAHPGTGKSTTMKFAYEHYKTLQTSDEILISFFFNARGADNERTTLGMWAALTYQLLQAAPDLLDVLDEMISRRVIVSRKNTLSREESHLTPRVEFDTTTPFTTTKLQSVFKKALSRLASRRLRCLIDALDECDEDEIREMLDIMEEIGRSQMMLDNEIRICFASRYYPNIVFEYGHRIEFEEEPGHRDDLEKYVFAQLRRFQKITRKVVRAITQQILERAKGVFIWTVLVISMLKNELTAGRVLDIQDKLRDTPQELSELFRQMLHRDNKNLANTLFALQCILFAKRPMSWLEFYYATSRPSGDRNWPNWPNEHDSEIVTSELAALYVSDSTKGLAGVTKTDQPSTARIEFIHESVRDFLIRDSGLSEIWPGLKPDLIALSHEAIKQNCYCYIRAVKRRSVEQARQKKSSQQKSLSRQYPFLAYATRHVLHHAENACGFLSQAEFMENFDTALWLEFFTLYCERDNYYTNASLLYILAGENCAKLIRTIFPEGPPIGTEGQLHNYALFVAIYSRNKEAVHAILGTDDVPNIEDLYESLQSSSEYQTTPLIWAIQCGYNGIAQGMLHAVDCDEIIRRCDGGGLNALDHAIIARSIILVKDLLDRGLKPNLVDRDHQAGFFNLINAMPPDSRNLHIRRARIEDPSYALVDPKIRFIYGPYTSHQALSSSERGQYSAIRKRKRRKHEETLHGSGEVSPAVVLIDVSGRPVLRALASTT